MTLLATEAPFPQFFDFDGDPLDEGSIYYGLAYQNPVTAPVPIYWDSAQTQPAAQPIKTLNGYPVRFGTPSNVFTDQTYSISVYDKKGRLIYTAPNSADYNPLPSLVNKTDPALGSALIGYLPPWAGAVGQTVSQRLQEYVSAQEFGLKTTNTGAQNNTAMAAAITYASSVGGATIHIPRGTFNFATTIDFTSCNNSRITGDGIDATILQINHATANFLTVNGIYQSIDNLTLTSSVTRTAGAMIFATGFWQRGLIERIKVSRHFDGINLRSFEECHIVRSSIVNPSGAGSGIIAGIATTTNQGANLTLLSLFIRGSDDTAGVSPPATGLYCLQLYDIQAIYAISCDMGGVANNVMYIAPQTACENCFFVQCYFDTTVGGDNIIALGAGFKNRFIFTGCWIGGAGRYVLPGVPDCAGVTLGAGTYADWMFTGCRFLATSGPGFRSFNVQTDVTITGCNFSSCAANVVSSAFTSIQANHPGVQTAPMTITGNKFTAVGTSTSDIEFTTANSTNNTITGNQFAKGIKYAAGASFASVEGNGDPNTSDAVASATTLQISPTKHFYTITGTTNVGGLYPTYTGHMVTFVATGVFTWLQGGALQLAGGVNYTTAAGSTLTLICQPGGTTWREVSRHA